MMGNPVRSAFIYLMHLAWKSRLHIPFLLTVCFLVFDIRLQLEVNIDMGGRRPRHIAIDPNRNENNDIPAIEDGNFAIDDSDFDDDDDDDDDDDEDEDDDHEDELEN